MGILPHRHQVVPTRSLIDPNAANLRNLAVCYRGPPCDPNVEFRKGFGGWSLLAEG